MTPWMAPGMSGMSMPNSAWGPPRKRVTMMADIVTVFMNSAR